MLRMEATSTEGWREGGDWCLKSVLVSKTEACLRESQPCGEQLVTPISCRSAEVASDE